MEKVDRIILALINGVVLSVVLDLVGFEAMVITGFILVIDALFGSREEKRKKVDFGVDYSFPQRSGTTSI